MKRFITVCISFTSILLFAGCKVTSADKREADIKEIRPKKTVTLQVYDELTDFSGQQGGWFGQVLLDKFNVQLSFVPKNKMSDNEKNPKADIIVWQNGSDKFPLAANDGMLYDWEQKNLLKKYGPYINSHLVKNIEHTRTFTTSKKIYGFGNNSASNAQDKLPFVYTWDIRFDLYKQLGCPKINDLNDLANILAKMQEICPADEDGKKTYGLSLFPDWDNNLIFFAKALAGAYYGLDEFGFGFYNPQNGSFVPCLDKESPYVDCLAFLNTLYKRNILDPESAHQNYDRVSEKYKKGTVFFNVFNWMASLTYNTDNHTSAGKAMYAVSPEKAITLVNGMSVYGANQIWSIGSQTAYPELCMAILNWLATPDGFMTMLYGPKEVIWNYDKNDKTFFTELGAKCQSDNNTVLPSPYSGTYKDGISVFNNTTWSVDASNPDAADETYNKQTWKTNVLPENTAIEGEWRKWSQSSSANEYMGKRQHVVIPFSFYVATPLTDELKKKWDNTESCILSYSWKAVYAKNNDEFSRLIAEMTEQAEICGYKDCCAYQAQEAIYRKQAQDNATATIEPLE